MSALQLKGAKMGELPSDPGEAALDYAARGWSVVPVHRLAGGLCTCRRPSCPSVAKHPRVRWEPFMAAAAGVATVREWWRRLPQSNVGIITGAVSGIAVLDVDPRNGGDATLARLEAEQGSLPETCEASTGGGGRHLWFALADGAVATTTVGPGLDVKAEGGMVVAPPSVHASGRSYEWVPGRSPYERDPAPLPRWLAEAAAGGAGRDVRAGVPVRTLAEQEEFAAAWTEFGIELAPGDRYYLCPFHPDHHPSLHVDAAGCRWYCFGCEEGGGIGRLRHLLGDHTRVRAAARIHDRPGRSRPVTLRGAREVEIVGESHHQDALLDLTGGRRAYGGAEVETVAELVPDPDNPFDPAAIEVRIDDLTVGHIGREDLEWVRLVVDDGIDLHGFATCRAVIRGGWDRGRGDVGLFGVVVFLDDR